jgi:hypothetical protein
VAGINGYSVEVCFNMDGTNEKVSVYFSTDKLDPGERKIYITPETRRELDPVIRKKIRPRGQHFLPEK